MDTTKNPKAAFSLHTSVIWCFLFFSPVFACSCFTDNQPACLPDIYQWDERLRVDQTTQRRQTSAAKSLTKFHKRYLVWMVVMWMAHSVEERSPAPRPPEDPCPTLPVPSPPARPEARPGTNRRASKQTGFVWDSFYSSTHNDWSICSSMATKQSKSWHLRRRNQRMCDNFPWNKHLIIEIANKQFSSKRLID